VPLTCGVEPTFKLAPVLLKVAASDVKLVLSEIELTVMLLPEIAPVTPAREYAVMALAVFNATVTITV